MGKIKIIIFECFKITFLNWKYFDMQHIVKDCYVNAAILRNLKISKSRNVQKYYIFVSFVQFFNILNQQSALRLCFSSLSITTLKVWESILIKRNELQDSCININPEIWTEFSLKFTRLMIKPEDLQVNPLLPRLRKFLP